MPVEIPANLTPELVPFAWLLGTWEGNGFMGYRNAEQRAFRQRVTFEQHGLPYVVYTARTTLLNDEGEPQREATYEQGFWELARPREDGDIGPGMLPPDPVPVLQSADSVEAYIRESITKPSAYLHPGEMYSAGGTSFMPNNYAESLTDEQIDQLAAYLATFK